jgi:hypothetical protein
LPPWSACGGRGRGFLRFKIGAKIVRHGRSITFQLAEVMVSRGLFAEILMRIARLRVPPVPA